MMSLDQKRYSKSKYDVLCCVKGPATTATLSPGLLQDFIQDVFVPTLFKPWSRILTLVIFAAWLCSSLAVLPRLEIGLDQEITMPDDSHVLKYFTHLKSYLSVGPPVYFVLNNTKSQIDFSLPAIQNKICGGQGCDQDSLQSQIKLWSKEPQTTYIGSPAQSWIDDYFGWSKDCCRTFVQDGQFCPSDFKEDKSEASSDYGDYGDYGSYGDFNAEEPKTGCEFCSSHGKSRPDSGEFKSQLQWFLLDVPGQDCPKAGKAAYSDAVRTSNGSVVAHNFFAFHTILKTSEDYYEAMRWARRLSDNISLTLNRNSTDSKDEQVNVFPYSVFYVFYEQYLTMVEDTATSLGISLCAVFAVTFLLGGFDIKTAIVTTFTIILILVNLIGLMYWWSVTLNAISLVNLVMASGISVEFCSHIIRDFALNQKQV